MLFRSYHCSLASRLAFASVLMYLCGFGAGCGTGVGAGQTGSGTGPVAGQNTAVTLLVSSTANDQLSQFNLTFNSITLTSQSGKIVSLLPINEHAEWIHVNGKAEPLVTVNVPQDVYTSATATVGPADFTCVGRASSGGVAISTYANGYTPNSQVSVTMPSSITISGTSMGLSLNLLVSASASWSAACSPSSAPGTFEINPTFSLTSTGIVSQPTNVGNGLLSGLDGMISSMNSSGSGFTLTAVDGPVQEITQSGDILNPSGPVWQVETNSSTAYQGISGVADLVPGMAVDMDAAVQQDGSLLATRIAVADTDTTNLSVYSGPLMTVESSEPVLFDLGTEQEGYFADTKGLNQGMGGGFSFDNAIFQISSQPANLPKLPFAAEFDATNMVAGQNISITSHATSVKAAPIYIPATTITLMPQTINGTVNAIATSGDFTVYTVTLAAYDVFPQLAVQSGQTTLLNDPGTVEVYTDSSTTVLTTNAPTVGSIVRFTGLVFNDNGTLRMDCNQLNNGVPE